MDCSELKLILDPLEDIVIPDHVHHRLEEHFSSCHTCRAAMANFLQIGKILEKTVYGENVQDNLLRYICSITGRNHRWGAPGEKTRQQKKTNLFRLLIKVAAGFAAAAGLGASLAVILGYLGVIGGGNRDGVPVEIVFDSTTTEPFLNREPATEKLDQIPGDSSLAVVVPEGGLNPEAVFNYLNSVPPTAANTEQGTPSLSAEDSTRLRTMEAELGALRDALSRDPGDTALRRRMMEKYRQVIDERKRLQRMLRVQDYYNLGYLHYTAGEYPQTAIVTGEGLRLVRMGPKQYLHYLKAMSHFQVAARASAPLPADTTADNAARVSGALMRAELDREGRRRAVNELRRAITEFSHLLSSPELGAPAREWILRCNEQIGQLSNGN